MYSAANYVFLYCFEVRRANIIINNKIPEEERNWTFLYGQVLTIVIVPLIFLIIWKLARIKKPSWIKVGTLLIPLLVVLSLIITSGRIKYDSHYLSLYMIEIGAALLYAISLAVMKHTQKSFYNTVQTIFYSDMLLSCVFYLLRYFKMFVFIYEDQIHPNVAWYSPLQNSLIIILGMSYLTSILLISQMMWHSQKQKSGHRWSSSKVRITTLLCLKAFE